MRNLLIMCLLLGACGDDGPGDGTCGVSDVTNAGAIGFAISPDTMSTSVIDFTWGANNDCPAGGTSVISVTLRGHQSDAADFGLGFCLPRPDLIGASAIDVSDQSRVRLVGASAMLGGDCSVGLAPDARPTGTVTFVGFCTDAGTTFQMVLQAQVAGSRSCAGTSSAETITLNGSVLVEPQP